MKPRKKISSMMGANPIARTAMMISGPALSNASSGRSESGSMPSQLEDAEVDVDDRERAAPEPDREQPATPGRLPQAEGGQRQVVLPRAEEPRREEHHDLQREAGADDDRERRRVVLVLLVAFDQRLGDDHRRDAGRNASLR